MIGAQFCYTCTSDGGWGECGLVITLTSRTGFALFSFVCCFVECLGVKATPEQNFVLNEKDKILIYKVRVISPLSYVFKPLRK